MRNKSGNQENPQLAPPSRASSQPSKQVFLTEQASPSPSSEVLHRASNLNTEQATKSSTEQATSTECVSVFFEAKGTVAGFVVDGPCVAWVRLLRLRLRLRLGRRSRLMLWPEKFQGVCACSFVELELFEQCDLCVIGFWCDRISVIKGFYWVFASKCDRILELEFYDFGIACSYNSTLRKHPVTGSLPVAMGLLEDYYFFYPFLAKKTLLQDSCILGTCIEVRGDVRET
ncbi:hypothetical protein Droror1_Dr00006467, partial [Drosera rotundifolia]